MGGIYFSIPVGGGWAYLKYVLEPQMKRNEQLWLEELKAKGIDPFSPEYQKSKWAQGGVSPAQFQQLLDSIPKQKELSKEENNNQWKRLMKGELYSTGNTATEKKLTEQAASR